MSVYRLPPYARSMGMEIDLTEDGTPIIAMDFSERAMGRPGFLHGGAIGGLLEMAAHAALRAELGRQAAERGGAEPGADIAMKPVNVSLEYLRNGMPQRTFAKGLVLRAGRRVANVRAEAWQTDREKPIASCWMNFLLAAPKAG